MAGGVTAAKRPAFLRKSRRACASETKFWGILSVYFVLSLAMLALRFWIFTLFFLCEDHSSPKGLGVAGRLGEFNSSGADAVSPIALKVGTVPFALRSFIHTKTRINSRCVMANTPCNV
ncbi:hypothetical protein [Mesorhizobium sp. ORS 3428]|uniref:hypothetical protein n=1 Tax=Mesorhizobium sp. ORS 3428 TaxID=540997 RepID=UPI0008DA4F98|nr:hypothetical protein [Mesorhizobium sp. ORS 3428]OHV88646.1 hypothetical protein ORS3428_18335 [Mesorhizobium sp. ORS 3428]